VSVAHIRARWRVCALNLRTPLSPKKRAYYLFSLDISVIVAVCGGLICLCTRFCDTRQRVRIAPLGACFAGSGHGSGSKTSSLAYTVFSARVKQQGMLRVGAALRISLTSAHRRACSWFAATARMRCKKRDVLKRHLMVWPRLGERMEWQSSICKRTLFISCVFRHRWRRRGSARALACASSGGHRRTPISRTHGRRMVSSSIARQNAARRRLRSYRWVLHR